jgi:hypothetical protein
MAAARLSIEGLLVYAVNSFARTAVESADPLQEDKNPRQKAKYMGRRLCVVEVAMSYDPTRRE